MMDYLMGDAQMKLIEPDHPFIRYTGRVDFSDIKQPCFSFPGVSVRIRFHGASLRVKLRDNAPADNEILANWFCVVVDGELMQRFKVQPKKTDYILADRLPNAVHEIELVKQTESGMDETPNCGKVIVGGFLIAPDAQIMEPMEKPLKMEFIGDSITCGYGNLLSSRHPEKYTYSTELSDAYMAYGAIAARQLNAEYLAVGYSGRGLLRNHGGYRGTTIPEMYLKCLPDDPNTQNWNICAYTPDILVINLGTNDFSDGIAPGKSTDDLEKRFVNRYQTFLLELIGFYPRAQFILTMGPMLSDRYPAKCLVRTRVRRSLRKIANSLNRKMGRRVYVLEMSSHRLPVGVDFHPTVSTHLRMARRLVLYIRILQKTLWT